VGTWGEVGCVGDSAGGNGMPGAGGNGMPGAGGNGMPGAGGAGIGGRPGGGGKSFAFLSLLRSPIGAPQIVWEVVHP